MELLSIIFTFFCSFLVSAVALVVLAFFCCAADSADARLACGLLIAVHLAAACAVVAFGSKVVIAGMFFAVVYCLLAWVFFEIANTLRRF